MTWTDVFFGALLAAFAIGGLMIRRWMVGSGRKASGDGTPHDERRA